MPFIINRRSAVFDEHVKSQRIGDTTALVDHGNAFLAFSSQAVRGQLEQQTFPVDRLQQAWAECTGALRQHNG